MRNLLYIICAAFLPIVCEAGGSLGLSGLTPLLKQKPALTSFLSQSFELSDSVFAEVRLGPDFAHLSAYRLGPYSIRANPKGSKDISPVLITLCTQYQFLGANGKVLSQETDEMFQATQVKEELTAVLIQDISAEDKRPVCPD